MSKALGVLLSWSWHSSGRGQTAFRQENAQQGRLALLSVLWRKRGTGQERLCVGGGSSDLGTEGIWPPTAPTLQGTTAPLAAAPAQTPKADVGLKIGENDVRAWAEVAFSPRAEQGILCNRVGVAPSSLPIPHGVRLKLSDLCHLRWGRCLSRPRSWN